MRTRRPSRPVGRASEPPRRALIHTAAILAEPGFGGAEIARLAADHGEVVRVDPSGPLLVSIGAATDLAVDAAIAGM